MPLETALVRFPFSREEDKVVKLSTPTKDRDLLQGFLQDDVDAAMHFVSVCNPPQVQPVSVKLLLSALGNLGKTVSATHLMIGHHHKSMREIATKGSVIHLVQLVLHAFVSGNANSCRSPPLGHGRNKNSK